MNIPFDIDIAGKLFFNIAGCICIFTSLKSLLDLIKLELKGIKAYGRIVDTIIDNTGDEIRHFPLIEFQTQEGKIIKVKKEYFIYGPYSIGQTIPIIYNPRKPSKMVVNTFINKYFTIAIFLTLGMFILSLVNS